MEETISLWDVVRVLRKRMSLIIIMMFLGLGVAGAITFFVITPEYGSQAQLIVRLPKNDIANVNDINANLQMITTYKDLIKSDTVVNEVKQRLKLEHNSDISVSQLKGSIQVVQSENSQMFSITSKFSDPVVAENIANQTALVFQEKAKDMLLVDKISIISPAVANFAPISPNNQLNILLGLIGGFIFGVALAFVVELFDRTVKDDRFISEDLGLAVLGTVPAMTSKELQAKVSLQTSFPSQKERGGKAPSRKSRNRVQ